LPYIAISPAILKKFGLFQPTICAILVDPPGKDTMRATSSPLFASVVLVSFCWLAACAQGSEVEEQFIPIDETDLQGGAAGQGGGSGSAGDSGTGGSGSSTGGTSGASGTGGTASSQGAGGSSGSDQGGNSGTAGTGASGGTAGSAGDAGAGGVGGSGSGGSSGGSTCFYVGNACTAADDLGSVSGDSGSDQKTDTGTTSHWYKVKVTEDSLLPSGVKVLAQLTTPPGMTYETHLYETGGSSCPGSEIGGPVGASAYASWSDSPLSNDDKTVLVEVRYVSGTACGDAAKWTLTIKGNKTP
jgi:hypothetical protein